MGFNIIKDYDLTLTEAVTCEWVNGFQDHGPVTTLFDTNTLIHLYLEIHGDMFGKYLEIQFMNNDEYIYQMEGLIAEHTTDYWLHMAFNPKLMLYTFGHGAKRYDIYVDGIFIGSSNEFNILDFPCDYFITQDECIRHGCYWVNGACQATAP